MSRRIRQSGSHECGDWKRELREDGKLSRKSEGFPPPAEGRGESYLFQKYIMMGKRDMIAAWKRLRSRWPSEMAVRMESFWASEMFTYPQSGSQSLAGAPGKAPQPLRPPLPQIIEASGGALGKDVWMAQDFS